MRFIPISLFVLLAGSIEAHHSTAMFDLGKQAKHQGVVSKFNYTNPHVYIFVTVEKDGKTETLRVEGGSPIQLNRSGWSSKILTEGEKISVTVRPTKDGQSSFGLLVSVTKEDGKTLEAPGADAAQQ